MLCQLFSISIRQVRPNGTNKERLRVRCSFFSMYFICDFFVSNIFSYFSLFFQEVRNISNNTRAIISILSISTYLLNMFISSFSCSKDAKCVHDGYLWFYASFVIYRVSISMSPFHIWMFIIHVGNRCSIHFCINRIKYFCEQIWNSFCTSIYHYQFMHIILPNCIVLFICA